MSTAKRIVVIDCQSAGISGDMILGALLDLGADLNKMDEAMKCVRDSLSGCSSLQLTVREVTRKGFRAKKADVKTIDEAPTRTGRELKDALHNSMTSLKLPRETVQLATGAMDTLIKAEAELHGESVDEVHLHEAGSADTIADIVGTVVALEDLNLSRDTVVYATPIAVGGGLLAFSHGTVSTPAPATLEILRSKAFPMIGGPVESELATPTGVSLLTNMAHHVSSLYPPMKPVKIGYGAGAVDYAETPNVLRMVIGEPFQYALANDEVHVLETNLDDVSGEVIGYVVDRLLEEGAKDVSIIPMFTKKNRPGHIVKIISDKKDVKHLARILVEETGTLGVREYPCGRHILLREVTSVNVRINEKSEPVRVKIAKDLDGEVVQVKPEYDDIEKLAKETGMPFRAIMEIATKKARSLIEKES
jgi:uncharacterized protein (TIGR00299 family) protein